MSSVRSDEGLELDPRRDHSSAWESDWDAGERPTVVAEILSDGTVQVLDRACEDQEVTHWGSGVIGGRGWTVWWERRRWN
jgi:hypothetical protein